MGSRRPCLAQCARLQSPQADLPIRGLRLAQIVMMDVALLSTGVDAGKAAERGNEHNADHVTTHAGNKWHKQ